MPASHRFTLSLTPKRLYLIKAFVLAALLLTALFLLPAPHARAQGYTILNPDNGGYSGGQVSGQVSNIPPPNTPFTMPYGFYNNTYGGGSSTYDDGSTASASGAITATFTWVPSASDPNQPLPQSVIVVESCTADALAGDGVVGNCSTGFSGDGQSSSSGGTISGTRYTGHSSPGASFTVQDNPSASSSPGLGQVGGVSISYSASASPITISLGGVTTDYKLLTGQQCTATLNGIPSGCTVTSYTWSVGGKAFKTYDTSRTNNDQLVPLGPADLTGPATGITNVAPVSFYDGTMESLTVSCTASLTAPDGTPLTVSAKAPQITVLKPTVTNWGIDTGFVQALTTSSNGNEFGLFKNPTSSDDEGEQWHDVAVSVPSPFSGGQCTFTQIVNPDREAYIGNASTPIDSDNGHIGLDGSFLYGAGWSLPGVGRDGDSPALIANGNTSYTQLAASDALMTYVMYRPPSSGTGTVWVPLQKYSWSWSETLSWQNARWNITAAYPATPGASPQYTPQNTDDPPQWNVVHGH